MLCQLFYSLKQLNAAGLSPTLSDILTITVIMPVLCGVSICEHIFCQINAKLSHEPGLHFVYDKFLYINVVQSCSYA